MLISIVQRHLAVSAPQKATLADLSLRAEHNFQRVDDIEWVVTKERASVTMAVRLRANAGTYRARATAVRFAEAAHEVMARVLTQRRRAKRELVDRRDDETRKGSGRRRPRR